MRYNTVDTCVERVKKYFYSDDFSQPIFINTENYDEYSLIKSKLSVSAKVVAVSSYCRAPDDNPKIDELIDEVCNAHEKILLVGLSSYFMLQGDKMLRRCFDSLCCASIQGKLAILCYQVQHCLLDFCECDIRNERRFCFLQGAKSSMPEITLISQKMEFPAIMPPVVGIKALLQKLENSYSEEISVVTHKVKSNYSESLIVLHEIKDAYGAVSICCPDVSNVITKSCGTDDQWLYLLEKISENADLNSLFKSVLGSSSHLEMLFHKWNSFTNEQRWIFYISLKLKGAGGNEYVNATIGKTESFDTFIKQLFRGLLDIAPTDSRFRKLYSERKELLKVFNESIEYIADYCQFAEIKGTNKIYYLTDNTQIERFEIVKCLSRFEYSDTEILTELKTVYPDLANYLAPYRFNLPLLDDYFQIYKYQKLTNAIRPEFLSIVNEHAANREYNMELPYRSEKFESINKKDAYLYFFDALGVEFLGYIMAKCRQYGLNAHITICHSKLPSITCLNKEFLDEFDLAKVISIKEFDDIKHHGEEDFDYQKTHYPIHVTRELEIIDDVLTRIKSKLSSGGCKKAIVISDHGASRLAVINENTYNFDVDAKGTHGGRCCTYSADLPKIDFATEENGYYVLASYDRFKGGRAASVETHGGATLEEVVVPIIELTQRPTDIEVSFIEDVITVSFRKKAEIILFTKTKLDSITLWVNGKYYTGEQIDDNRYRIIMKDITHAGVYKANVYDGDNLLFEGLPFHVEKEGSKEKDLF